MATTIVGERYEPFHKMRNGSVNTLLTYSHGDSAFHVTLEQSSDPSIYNFVHLDSHTKTRRVVGKITGLHTYTNQYPPNMQMFDHQKDKRVKSGVYKIIKSQCSGFVLIQMSQTNRVECYSLTPEFGNGFEIFAYKVFEYEPVAGPAYNPGVAAVGMFQGGVAPSGITYSFTPSGKFIYCTYSPNKLIKIETTTGRVIYNGTHDQGERAQLIPVNDDIICLAYKKSYDRNMSADATVLLLATEQRLIFQLGLVGGSNGNICEWLDTYKVLSDDSWILSATFGERFNLNTKLHCILGNGSKLYFTIENRVSWCVACIPILLAELKFGQGQITYQHPMTDRDTLCPALKYDMDGKFYGAVMNNANFQLVCIADGGLEVLAAGHHFNLPGRELWDHSAKPHELEYIDIPSHGLISKIASTIHSLVTGIGNNQPVEAAEPGLINSNEYLDSSHVKSNTQIKTIEFTSDLACVLVSHESDTYVYKAKMSYREVGELVDTMDTTLAGLGIELPVELVSDIACTVAVPSAVLDVKDELRAPMDTAELEYKLAICENDRINDKEAKVKKLSDPFPHTQNTRQTGTRHTIIIQQINNIQYSTEPDVNYQTMVNNQVNYFGTLE